MIKMNTINAAVAKKTEKRKKKREKRMKYSKAARLTIYVTRRFYLPLEKAKQARYALP